MITACSLSRSFGEKEVLRDVDLDVPRGGFLLVTGRNGSGKSTLLRLFAGLLAPTGGVLTVEAARSAIGYVGHEPLVYRELTALENLDLYGRLYRIPERRERCGALLERYGLWRVRSEQAGTFSRGMLQRLALCRALLHDPDLLLFDEPFAGLDAEGEALLTQELAEGRERTAIVATHDPEALAPLATARLALA